MFLVMLLFSSVSLPDHPDRIPSTSYPQHIPHPPPSHAILTPSLSLLLQVPHLSANLFRDPSLPTPLLLPAPVFLLLKLPLAPFLKIQCILSCFSRHAENVEIIKISSWVKPTLAISNLRKTHKHICSFSNLLRIFALLSQLLLLRVSHFSANLFGWKRKVVWFSDV